MINIFVPIARLFILPMLMFASNTAYAATTIVYPTGVSPTDIQNVQTAVSAGGNILLKATNQAGKATSFNFGNWNANTSIPVGADVVLTNNAAICGETVGANKTTITGGVYPFYEDVTSVKTSIAGIKFVNPQGAAIELFRSNGISITNCEIAGVLPFLNDAGVTDSSGIYVIGLSNTTVTGPVVISGNYIHGLDGQDEFGIQLNSVESAMTIAGNTIVIGDATDAAASQVNSTGIVDYDSTGAALISGNFVSVGSGVCFNAIAVHGPATGVINIIGNEVTVPESAICYNGIEITGATGAAMILANSIVSDSPYTAPIALVGEASQGGNVSNVTISLNAIDVENSNFGAITLLGAVAKSSISLNLITGESAYGISAETDYTPTDLIASNTFLSNLFLSYKAADATVFFDTTTSKNIFLGPYTTVINKGSGNTIIKGL